MTVLVAQAGASKTSNSPSSSRLSLRFEPGSSKDAIVKGRFGKPSKYCRFGVTRGSGISLVVRMRDRI
jgi:hypothetical protein